MVSTFTPNVQLEEPARGDDVGTWDIPVNNNMTLLDLIVGGITTISLNNTNVTLSAAQFKCKNITFNSTLTGSVVITFPTSFTKSYEIQNLCTGTSAFTITLTTTAAGGQVICCPFGETIDCFNDGTNLKYKNLGRVGSYWDYAGSSVPNWVSGCTVAPYLNCDGTSFSSATFPQLTVVLGGTTLPDGRGRYRAALNQTTGRITSTGGGVDGNTLLASGSSNTRTLITANLPPYTPAGNLTVLGLKTRGGAALNSNDPNSLFEGNSADTLSNPNNGPFASATWVGTPQGGTSTPFSVLPPTYIGGLTLVRSA